MTIIFKQSAFRHKITQADILHAFANVHYDGQLDDGYNRFIRLGFDTNGNLLEIMYNEYSDHICIFHAMLYAMQEYFLQIAKRIGETYGSNGNHD